MTNRWVANGALIATVFAAVQNPIVSVALRGGRRVLPVIAGLRLRGGQRDDRGACHDLLQQRRGLLATCAAQQSARDHDRVDIGFNHQGVTERLGDDHEFDWPAADSAHILGQGGAEYPELVCEGTPDLRLPSCPGLGRGPALLEVVAGGQKLGQPVPQQFLFLAQFEVHQSPNAALARMLR